MSRAKERALDRYPICKHSNYGYKDLNEDKRKCYIGGYEQAEKDFMKKAEKAFKEKFGCLNDGALWIAFKEYMTK